MLMPRTENPFEWPGQGLVLGHWTRNVHQHFETLTEKPNHFFSESPVYQDGPERDTV